MNFAIEERINELKEFYFEDIHQFTYIYGSYATEYATENSDLDIVTISNADKKKLIPPLKDFIVDFHNKYDLTIDEEVPYDKKLICSFEMMDDAVEGKGFHMENGIYQVPFLELSPEYLSSDELMQRILLNTITNKSLFVSGEKTSYEKYRFEGWKKMIEVVFNMEGDGLTLDKFVDRMIKKNGRVGRDYMGYSDEKSVRDYLQSEVPFFLDISMQQGNVKQKNGVYYYET
ncbi:MAG: nucleotidyltransferase domain-containing protein [Nanoarchaeota archaeon]|nr:nucleotidyltransferase domain-containing protein [Nanoarchaeota archaeon]